MIRRTLSFLLVLLFLAPLTWGQTINTIQGRKVARATLLSAVVATDDGVWIDIEGFNEQTVHIEGITTATAKVNISATPTKPANNAHGIEAASCAADCAVVVSMGVRWIKVRVSAYTSGTISAYLEAGQR